jgi:glycosyltransferase involved in cell wall biosynthesis
MMYVELAVALPSVTIIIPAYNEESRIKGVLDEISDFISTNNADWELIVSVDGDDGTADIVQTYSSIHPFIKLNKGNERGGKGNAIKRAVNKSSGEFTLLADADGAVSLQDILNGFPYCGIYDAILFDRYSADGNAIPLYRRIPSRGFNILVRAILGLKVTDTQCGYKLVRTSIIKEAFKRIGITNAFFDVALLYHIQKMGGMMKEIEVKYSHRDESKFNILALIIGHGISLFAFRIRHSRFYKYIPGWANELYLRKFRWI